MPVAKPENQNNQHRNSLRIAWISSAAGAATTAFDVYLVQAALKAGGQTWHLLILAGIAGVFTLVALLTAVLIRRGMANSIWLLITAGQVAFIAASALISGLGLISIISILALTSLITALSLPAKSSRTAIVLALITGSLAGLLDWIRPAFQMPAPAGLRVFLPGLLTLVALVFLAYLARSFRSFPLRTRS